MAWDRVTSRWNSWAVVPFALAMAAIATPYLLAQGWYVLRLALERSFALVCHQRPERSFVLFGGTVAVCARCLGIYLGAAMGLMWRTSRGEAMKLFVIGAAVNVIDVATELASLHGNWPGVRFVMGFMLGAVGGLLVSSAVGECGKTTPAER